jgi:hypothetical protein
MWPIARNVGGGMIFATVDKPEYAKDNGKEVGKLIRQGFSVSRVTGAEVKRPGVFGHKDDCAQAAKRGNNRPATSQETL